MLLLLLWCLKAVIRLYDVCSSLRPLSYRRTLSIQESQRLCSIWLVQTIARIGLSVLFTEIQGVFKLLGDVLHHL
jgi:hypothetical protein